MDAEKVHAFWRRLLRDGEIRRTVLEATSTAGLDLSSEEQSIGAAFAAHRDMTYWPAAGFHFRLVDELTESMAMMAPIVPTVLGAFGYDVTFLVQRFLEDRGFPDYGWHIHRAYRDFFAFVEARLSGSIVGLRDLVALETMRIEVFAHLADVPPELWTRPREADLLDERVRYRQSPAARAITLEHVLSPWLEASEHAHQIPLVRSKEHVIVYLESVDVFPEYATLTGPAKLAFDTLSEPGTLSELRARLGDSDLDAVRQVAGALLEAGMVRRAT